MKREAFTIKQKLKKIITAFLIVPLMMMFWVSSVSADEQSTTLQYHCLGSALGLIDVDIVMDVEVTSTLPERVAPGEEFSIENSYTTITMEVTELLRAATNPLEGNVSQFNLEFVNATETGTGASSVNVAEGGLTFGPIPIGEDQESVTFRVPETDGRNVNLTAGEEGVIEIVAGEIVTSVKALGLLDVDVTCNPVEGEDTTLTTIEVVAPEFSFVLVGDDPMEVDYGSEFVDPGVEVYVDDEFFDIIYSEDEVDTNQPGAYTLYYEFDGEIVASRTVIVNEPPEEPEPPEDPKDPKDPEDPKDPKEPKDPKDPEDPKDPKDPGKPGDDGANDDDKGTKDDDKKDVDKDDDKKGTTTPTKKNGSGDKLPKTATNNYTLLLIGAILSTLGSALLFIRKKATL